MPKSDLAPQSDDMGLLHELLTAPLPEQRSRLRPAQLRSIGRQRAIALHGYRFRGLIDRLLYRAERVLIVGIVAFFSYWFYDSYVVDWWHQRNNPVVATVDWQAVSAGASAAEVQLGSRLPSSQPASEAQPAASLTSAAVGGAPLARHPDYLVPAKQFVASPPPTATPAPPVNLTPLRIVVPAMQLDSPIREVFLRDNVWEVADYAVGYHNGTAYPSQGNTVLAGHAGIRGAVFARLPDLKLGDDIYLDTEGIRFHYQVTTIRSVWPNQVEVMYPTPESIITMITCTSWDTQRLVVTAILVDQAPLLPSGRSEATRGSSS